MRPSRASYGAEAIAVATAGIAKDRRRGTTRFVALVHALAQAAGMLRGRSQRLRERNDASEEREQ